MILESLIDKYQLRLLEEKKIARILRMSSNSRQAAVRTYGMKMATGDYVIHCDSDDWVDVQLYEKMYVEAIVNQSDVVFAPLKDEYNKISSLREFKNIHPIGKEIAANWYCTNIPMYLFNKLVKRNLYAENNIYPFVGVNMWEDNGLMLRILYYAKKVSSITGPAYHYNHTNISATTKGYGMDSINQMMNCAKLLEKFFAEKEDAPMYLMTVNALKFLAKINLITTEYRGLVSFKQTYPESNEAVHYISLNSFSTKGKIRFLFVKYHMSWLFVTLFKCFSLFLKK